MFLSSPGDVVDDADVPRVLEMLDARVDLGLFRGRPEAANLAAGVQLVTFSRRIDALEFLDGNNDTLFADRTRNRPPLLSTVITGTHSITALASASSGRPRIARKSVGKLALTEDHTAEAPITRARRQYHSQYNDVLSPE